jgi:hypothetical protein
MWYYRSVLMVEGFTLCIIVGCSLTVMSVTLSSRIQIAIWLLCIFFIPESWSWAHSHCLGTKVSQDPVLGWP